MPESQASSVAVVESCKARNGQARGTRRRAAVVLAGTLVASGFAGLTPADAATTNVPCPSGNTALQNGSNLAAAVVAAALGDTLVLDDYCVYGFNDSNKQEAASALAISKNLTISAPTRATIRREGGTLRLIHTTSSDLTLTNVAVLNGNPGTGLNGGGILVDSGSALIATALSLQGNTTDSDGGGLATNIGGAITLTGGDVTGNSAGSEGGGLYMSLGASADLHGVTVTGNQATGLNGGGIHSDTTLLTIDQNSTISDNSAPTGAGLYTTSSSLTMTGSSVTGNAATSSGGGLVLGGTTATLTDSLISSNTVSGSGGSGAGIAVTAGTTTLSGTQVTGNILEGSSSNGAGIAVTGGTLSVGSGSQITKNLGKGTFSTGGGIYNNARTVSVDSSYVDSNLLTGIGSYAAGIYNTNAAGGSFSITNSTVDSNRAPSVPAPGGVWTDTQFTSTTGTDFSANAPTSCILSPVIPTGCLY